MVLDIVRNYFVEDFCAYICKGYLWVLVFCVSYLFLFLTSSNCLMASVNLHISGSFWNSPKMIQFLSLFYPIGAVFFFLILHFTDTPHLLFHSFSWIPKRKWLNQRTQWWSFNPGDLLRASVKLCCGVAETYNQHRPG